MILAALGIGRGDVVAVAGAGGKTTLIYRLAAEARACGLRVLVTTTTHMGTLDEALTGPVLVEAEGDTAAALEEALAREGRVTLLGRRVRPDKLEGLDARRVDALARIADLVVVEADGARGRSLKVPAPHEPSWCAPPPAWRWARRWTRTAWRPRSAIRTAIPRVSRIARGRGCS
ncbi:MAG: putative selenium-dependent hydroxylase accessory protein YqeC [Acidobacteria bacterium]|nr:MAG: putative selenium-dependent hydroxylase accessory protein YqeC [Acidobacteriota bacterium]